MFRSKKIATATVTATIALGLTLTGCANPIESLIQGGVNKAAEGFLEQATGGEFKLGGTDLPDGFPSEVPLPNGTLAQSLTIDGTYTLAFEVDETEVDGFLKTLESKGFAGGDGMDSAEGYMKAYDDGTWNVVVTGTKSGADSYIAMIVSPKE